MAGSQENLIPLRLDTAPPGGATPAANPGAESQRLLLRRKAKRKENKKGKGKVHMCACACTCVCACTAGVKGKRGAGERPRSPSQS